jgi:hypothetical protein
MKGVFRLLSMEEGNHVIRTDSAGEQEEAA